MSFSSPKTQNIKARAVHGKETITRRSVSGNGGEGGIRTHGGIAPSSVFKTDAFDHSATSPRIFNLLEFKYMTIFNSETQI